MEKEKPRNPKEKRLYDLHHNDKLLVLPNIWDPLGATLLQELGYPAVATASASIAFANGYDDGQQIPFDNLLSILARIVSSVSVPVTADIESGYADDNATLVQNVKKLVDTGIAGINFEDSLHDGATLTGIEQQAEKIHLIKETAAMAGCDLFINARTDVFLKLPCADLQNSLEEAIKRGKAYKEAGADCFYPIFLKEANAIQTLMKEVGLPVNVLMVPGIPSFAVLQQAGVSRISLGPGFLKKAIAALKESAEKLLRYEDMEGIINNPVTTAYLKHLIVK